jgi:hypothetical protein
MVGFRWAPLALGSVVSVCAASTAAQGQTAASPPDGNAESPRPPPLHVEYVQYGVAITGEGLLSSGAVCPDDATTPCILGGGGGLVIRGGFRTAGPWYYGGAYQFIRTDTNLYRLPIFQQLRAEMRYHPDTGTRIAPYATWGVGGLLYGNEWGAETGGALAFGGGGVELEVSRVALVGLGLAYRPMLIAGWTDTAGQVRNTGLAQYLGIELQLEVRTELGRQ